GAGAARARLTVMTTMQILDGLIVPAPVMGAATRRAGEARLARGVRAPARSGGAGLFYLVTLREERLFRAVSDRRGRAERAAPCGSAGCRRAGCTGRRPPGARVERRDVVEHVYCRPAGFSPNYGLRLEQPSSAG